MRTRTTQAIRGRTARNVSLATTLSAAIAIGQGPAAALAALGGRSGTLELEPQRSVVRFTLPGTLHETHGTFRIREGTVAVDGISGDASGLIVVDAASGESGNDTRDHKMQADVLEADRFPEIRFSPRHLDGTVGRDGSFDGTIRGVLTLHGADHDIAAPVRGWLLGSEVQASCRFSIPYVSWGIRDPSVLFLRVAREVSLDVEAVGHVHWAESPRDRKEGAP